MQTKKVIEVYNLLNDFQLSKFTDKDVRKGLILTYLNFGNVVKQHTENVEKLRKKFAEDNQKELAEVSALEQKLMVTTDEKEIEKINKERNKHSKFYTTLANLNSDVEELLNKDVEVEIGSIDREKFLDEVPETLTLAQIALLSDILE